MAAPEWLGKFAQVIEPGTPGWGPEGLVTYPEGIGGFIVRADAEGRAVVELGYFFGKPNPNLAAYGAVAFEIEHLHVGDGVQAWGEDDRGRPDSPEPTGRGGSPELNATGVGPRRSKSDDAPRHEPGDPAS